ncbi:Rft protein-domain-containing protein [Thamnocephalis sphaerospora]|uniref:Man(5)GlcNAc(2)-PP-dolichol translocation protein RFT1 n=1 Tax=Thamnocephalis sphaerospora TaxID=78915 RepID=A0A4P9XK10_9FUNG|nr:Rft protein-domain-containing protein [Thamnocephalis sphaerospora]|eukprot:RKP05550.1 Rft protein-domain-containing protein [Thamnocephalis sphaerospora]
MVDTAASADTLKTRQRPSTAAKNSATGAGNDAPDVTDAKPADGQSAAGQRVLSETLKGASYLMMLQFFSRIVTFTLNQVLLRYTTPDTLGVASVQLELLIASVLFLSREGFRCALLREDDSASSENKGKAGKATAGVDASAGAAVVDTSRMGRVQRLINLCYLPVAVGVLTSWLCCWYYMWSKTEADKQPFYDTAVVLYGVSALIELAAEPFFVLAQVQLLFRLRVTAEGVGVIVRCLLTLGITLYGARVADSNGNQYGVLAFAVAQLVYSVMLAGGHAAYFLPLADCDGNIYYFDRRLLALAITFAKQSVLKHVLTEGDKILMSLFCTAHDQGIYAFVVNYGSLIARIFFQPMEETARMFFAKTFPDVQTDDAPDATDDQDALAERQSRLSLAAQVLALVVKLHLLLGLVFTCFAPAYTGTLIDLLVGRRWSVETAAPAVLAIYCLYVPVMGVNGVTESFVQAIARPADVAAQSRAMLLFSVGFLAVGAVLMRGLHLGASALVLANAFNMLLRIGWSVRFTQRRMSEAERVLYATPSAGDVQVPSKRFFTQRFLLPSSSTVALALLGCLATWCSDWQIGWHTLRDKGLHIAVGLGAFLPFALALVRGERDFVRSLRTLLKQKRA